MLRVRALFVGAAAVTAIVFSTQISQAATCPSPIISGIGYVALTTSPASSCIAYGSTSGGGANINGNSSDPIVQLGYHYITGVAGSGDTGTFTSGILQLKETSVGQGTFTISGSPDAGYTQFVLAIKDGNLGDNVLDWGAFLLPAGVTTGSWSLWSTQGADAFHALSLASLYECSDAQCPAGVSPPGNVPVPGAAWLMGTVLGGAGFGAWRRRRRVKA